jgi:hypothetical protein
LHQLLLKGEDVATDLEKIPQTDREDFQSAWRAGHRKEACEILDRPSFAENVAVSSRRVTSQNGREQAGDKRSAIAEASANTEKTARQSAPATTSGSKPVSDADLSALSLDNFKSVPSAKPTQLPVNTPSQPSATIER